MPPPLVSVCILAYEDAIGLRRTLHYLQSQTYFQLEILVSDDASTKGDIESLVRVAGQADPRIRFFRQAKNLGIIGNHRFLLQQAQGKYLLWACQDDHWHPDYIREAVSALETQQDAVLAMGQAQVLDPIGRLAPYEESLHTVGLPARARFRQTCREIRWWNNAFYGLFRRAALEQVPLQDGFGFDLVQVALLSLHGPFVQLPQTYFVKQAGGVGNQLASGLAAIKVQSRWWLTLWPALGVWLGLRKGLRKQRIPVMARFGYLLTAWPILWSFPFGGIPFWQRARRYLRKQKYAFEHRMRQIYAQLFFQGSRRAIHQTYPWVKRDWLRPTETADQFHLQPLGLSLSWPQHKHVLNDVFGFRAFQSDGGKLGLSAAGNWQVNWGGLTLEMPGTMEWEVFKEAGIMGVYDATFPPESIVLDVGMNTGITALWLARHPELIRIYGYEPVPELFAQAEAQFGRNPGESAKIVAHPYGLAARARTASFAYSGEYGVYSSEFVLPPVEQCESVSVSLRSIGEELAHIASLHPQSPLIVKLDTEGAEYELIPALAEAGWLPNLSFLMIEWHERGPEPLLKLLHEAGFHTLLRQDVPERGMIYALSPDSFPLPLFQMCLHAAY